MSSLPGFALGTIRQSGLFPLSAAEGSIMLRPTIGFLLGLVIGIPAFASSPDPKTLAIPSEELTRARELVHQLGSEDFDERERAEAELAKMGRLARPALVEAANTDPSQEVRSRCSSLLPRATASTSRRGSMSSWPIRKGSTTTICPAGRISSPQSGANGRSSATQSGRIVRSIRRREVFSLISCHRTSTGR